LGEEVLENGGKTRERKSKKYSKVAKGGGNVRAENSTKKERVSKQEESKIHGHVERQLVCLRGGRAVSNRSEMERGQLKSEKEPHCWSRLGGKKLLAHLGVGWWSKTALWKSLTLGKYGFTGPTRKWGR